VDIFDETLVEPRAYKQPTEVHVRLSQVPSPRVLDLGGNIGLFALDCLRGYPLARVTCVEADPENISILRACAHLNPQARWTIIAAAASIQNGTVMFAAGNFADSAVSAYGTVSVPSIDVFPLLTDVDFVKMDIEGSEWPIVMDQRFESITAPVIVIEWHVRQAPAVRDPHALMLSRLNAAGYETAGSGTADHGTIWGWK
jgi:FkbM family methyltransferase